MESKKLVCSQKQAEVLRDLVYFAVMRSTNIPKNGYSSYCPVMFSVYKTVLLDETGLVFRDTYADDYHFDIVDSKKFFLIKIEYGF
jgi:hypothetical protein